MLRQILARASWLQRNAPGSHLDELDGLGEEFKLPKMPSLVIMIVYNIMLQVRSSAAL